MAPMGRVEMVRLTLRELSLSPPDEVPKVENPRERGLGGQTSEVTGPTKDRVQDRDSKASLFCSGQPMPENRESLRRPLWGFEEDDA
eukprot:3847401-Heterocapsa_arctica.AAC.1